MDSSSLEVNVPKDQKNLVYLIFVGLGVATLLPWNALITAADYFVEVLDNKDVSTWISLAYNSPQLLILLFANCFISKISLAKRTIVSCLVCAFCLAAIVPAVSLPSSKTVGLVLLIILSIIGGIAAAILFGSVLAIAALFPIKYTSAAMTGSGVAGVIIGILRIITKLIWDSDFEGNRNSAILFFSLSAAIMVASVSEYFLLQKVEFSRYYLDAAAMQMQSIRINNEDEETLLSKNCDEPTDTQKSIKILKTIWLEAIEVFGVFSVSLFLFPGLTAQICTDNEKIVDWFAVLNIFIFQVFDLIGRNLTTYFIIFTNKNLWIPIALRLLFIPLFILSVKPVLIPYYYSFIFMATFAITNGYCGTLAMMFAPDKVDNSSKEPAGFLMSLFLNIGLFVGVNLNLLLVLVLDPPSCQI
eukprot:TRINITY_DN86_c3_g1_i1.p1 TRINITY_DN86_c3_g1~~TRINITY_DN86_c3_g1_i1.p1  ORF type:complete len:415 (-),score=165.38 TRINITY_DN86_c3_g1_i1:75-1319(-)